MVLDELYGFPHKLLVKWLVKKGLKLGTNCGIARTVLIDPAFPWLISIGNNCTFSFNVMIIAHDASMKRRLGYSKIGRVTIGNNCFVGAGSIILPNVHIGDNVVVGAGSVVTHDIPSGSVVAGNPAKIIRTTKQFIEIHSAAMRNHKVYKKEGWTFDHGITEERKKILWESVKDDIAYIE